MYSSAVKIKIYAILAADYQKILAPEGISILLRLIKCYRFAFYICSYIKFKARSRSINFFLKGFGINRRGNIIGSSTSKQTF